MGCLFTGRKLRSHGARCAWIVLEKRRTASRLQEAVRSLWGLWVLKKFTLSDGRHRRRGILHRRIHHHGNRRHRGSYRCCFPGTHFLRGNRRQRRLWIQVPHRPQILKRSGPRDRSWQDFRNDFPGPNAPALNPWACPSTRATGRQQQCRGVKRSGLAEDL